MALPITPPLRQSVLSVGSAGLSFAMIRPCTAKKDKYIYDKPARRKAGTVSSNGKMTLIQTKNR